MIKIDKITDLQTINEIVNKYSLNYSNTDFILALTDQEIIKEFVQYSIEKDFLKIKYVSNNLNDFSLLDALMKTLIFYADLSMLRYIKADESMFDFANKMKFDLIHNEYIFDIYDIEKQKCKCEKDV